MKLEDCIARIKDEIVTINDELKEVCERLAALEADVRWIKWGVLTIASGILALLIKQFVQ